MLVVTVNTTRPSRHKDGEVSAEQVERVAARLRTATNGQLRVVVTHQPVHVLRGSEIHNRLHGYEPAITAWSTAGADIILGGHIHLPYVASLHEDFPRLTRRCWVVQAGTAVSSRVRERHPNSVNVITRVSAEDCVVERWDYSVDKNEFHTIKTERLHLDRAIKE
jgi:predicted phosphodiesterase